MNVIEIIKCPEIVELAIDEFEKDRKRETARYKIESMKQSIKMLQSKIKEYELEIKE